MKVRQGTVKLTAALLAVSLCAAPVLPTAAQAGTAASSGISSESATAATSGDSWKDKLRAALESLPQEDMSELFGFLQEKSEAGALQSDEDVEAAISEGEQKFGVKIGEEQKKQLLEGIEQLHALGLSPEQIVDQAAAAYEKYGADAVDHLGELAGSAATAAVKSGFAGAVEGFFASVQAAFKSFLADVFSKL